MERKDKNCIEVFNHLLERGHLMPVLILAVQAKGPASVALLYSGGVNDPVYKLKS